MIFLSSDSAENSILSSEKNSLTWTPTVDALADHLLDLLHGLLHFVIVFVVLFVGFLNLLNVLLLVFVEMDGLVLVVVVGLKKVILDHSVTDQVADDGVSDEVLAG